MKLPAWVARHGSKRSAAALSTFTRFRIILTNAVKYGTNVESYDRLIRNHLGVQDWMHFRR